MLIHYSNSSSTLDGSKLETYIFSASWMYIALVQCTSKYTVLMTSKPFFTNLLIFPSSSANKWRFVDFRFNRMELHLNCVKQMYELQDMDHMRFLSLLLSLARFSVPPTKMGKFKY